jgi:2-oxo-3-hexenedioate decarboxylase/2-keto-4-pentenoate hydratase
MPRAQAAAEKLMNEHSQRVRFHTIEGISDLAEAYDVQRNYVRLALGEDRIAGYKIGLTSAAMQTMCGIDRPIAGAIFSRNVHPGGARIALQDYFRLGLEFEICARLKDDLPPKGSAYTRGEVSGAAGHVCAAVELIEDRCADYASLDCKSVVADNAWNAGIVLGPFVPVPKDLAAVEGVAFLGEQEIGRGRGSDVLGHPFEPLAWLANHLIAQGDFLKAGDLVMTGSFIRTQFPAFPCEYRFDISSIGSVSLALY